MTVGMCRHLETPKRPYRYIRHVRCNCIASKWQEVQRGKGMERLMPEADPSRIKSSSVSRTATASKWRICRWRDRCPLRQGHRGSHSLVHTERMARIHRRRANGDSMSSARYSGSRRRSRLERQETVHGRRSTATASKWPNYRTSLLLLSAAAPSTDG
jgi:hypothetical protein